MKLRSLINSIWKVPWSYLAASGSKWCICSFWNLLVQRIWCRLCGPGQVAPWIWKENREGRSADSFPVRRQAYLTWGPRQSLPYAEYLEAKHLFMKARSQLIAFGPRWVRTSMIFFFFFFFFFFSLIIFLACCCLGCYVLCCMATVIFVYFITDKWSLLLLKSHKSSLFTFYCVNKLFCNRTINWNYIHSVHNT